VSEEELQREIQSLREQLAAAQRKAARAIARHQHHALAMETIRQNNAELDRLTSELDRARSAEAARARELEEANEKLRERERKNEELIARLQEVVSQLSTPVLRVGRGVLALPVVGTLDEERALSITRKVLDDVAATGVSCVVLDVTGVETVDAETTKHLIDVARATQLLGARCILCGIQPAVASGIARIGLDLGGIETARNLHQALATHRDPEERRPDRKVTRRARRDP
jgi:anti-anti-sigma regulatory factor